MLRVAADPRFELAGEGRSPVHGRLHGSGNRLRLEVGDPGACDVVLARVVGQRATITHDEDDEYVVCAVRGGVRVHGARVDRARLWTGIRVELGEHRLVFYRDEHADHGRPPGGRIGGGAGGQLPQAPRDAPG